MRTLVSEAAFYRSLTEDDARAVLLKGVAKIEEARTLGMEPAAYFDRVFKKEKSNNNLLKYLVAVGNLLIRQQPAFKKIVKTHLSDIINNLSFQVQDEDTQKVKEAHREVLSLL